jgi:hypothetical protein
VVGVAVVVVVGVGVVVGVAVVVAVAVAVAVGVAVGVVVGVGVGVAVAVVVVVIAKKGGRMKYVLVLLVLVMCCGMMGCLTSDQQRRIDDRMVKLDVVLEDIEKYRDMKDDVVHRFKTGELTAAEVKILLADLSDDIGDAKDAAKGFRDEIRDIQNEGGSPLDIIVGVALSILAGQTGLVYLVRRGSVNNRAGDIGVRK